jgi:ADP-heptose:LPS heptosyltransferase
MSVLILKLDSGGDVARTTALLRRLEGDVTWITAAHNTALLQRPGTNVRCLAWEDRGRACDRTYDLVINLEDRSEVARFVAELRYVRLFGAYLNSTQTVSYTHDSRRWFDLSLISAHGRAAADILKLQNRRTYQDLIFEGLGFHFAGETYLLPRPAVTDLVGDVALAPSAGPVWPMKGWAYYDRLKLELEARGLRVNTLPKRSSLLEHLSDVRNHRCLVSGDSLPMHVALGTGTPCVTLFNCTSPWEIHDYGLQTKIVSPLLEGFFYKRDFDARATEAIGVEEVLDAVLARLKGTTANREVRNGPRHS